MLLPTELLSRGAVGKLCIHVATKPASSTATTNGPTAFKVAGHQNALWQTPSNLIVNISSLILHSCMIFTALKLQYVIA